MFVIWLVDDLFCVGWYHLLTAEIAWESYYVMMGRWPFEGVGAGKNLACYTDVAAYQWFALAMIIVVSRQDEMLPWEPSRIEVLKSY